MWTAETRAEHDRDELRYPSDLTDAVADTGTSAAATRRDWPTPVLADACVDERDLLRARRLSLAHAAGTFPAVPRRPIVGLPRFAMTAPGKT
jgi:hypothetical protein